MRPYFRPTSIQFIEFECKGTHFIGNKPLEKD